MSNLNKWLDVLIDAKKITVEEALAIMDDKPPPEHWTLTPLPKEEKIKVSNAVFIEGKGIFGKEIQKIILTTLEEEKIEITPSEWLIVRKFKKGELK